MFSNLPNPQDGAFCKNSEGILVFDFFLAKSSIKCVWEDFQFATEASNNLRKKLKYLGYKIKFQKTQT